MRKRVRITTISNNEKTTYETTAILRDNTIIYIEEDSKKTKTHFNYDKIQLNRENKEISMQYNFAKGRVTTGQLLISEFQKEVSLRIITTDIIRYNHDIEIKFMVEKERIEYKIEVIK